MKFGIFYEHQLPRPWTEGAEQKLFNDALEQVEVADRLGIDYAWEVEHHFLEEYSHSSAPEVFLAACAARTKNIRLGQGIRQVIPQYNHPARTAEVIATLDLVSNGRVDFGTGESSARARTRRLRHHGRREAQDLPRIDRADLQHPRDGSVSGLSVGKYFSMPCRNLVPKPVQSPHPPVWVACSQRETIRMAARLGIGALTFAFVDPLEARSWVEEYYSIIKSDECVPIGHSGQRQHLHGVELLVPPGSRDGDQAGAQRIRILRLRARQPLWIRRAQTGPHESVAGIRKRVRQADARAAAGVRPGVVRRRRRHRHAGRPAHAFAQIRNGGRRPGDVHPAGRNEQARAHLRGAGAVCRRRDAGVQGARGGARAAKQRELAPYIDGGARAQGEDAGDGATPTSRCFRHWVAASPKRRKDNRRSTRNPPRVDRRAGASRRSSSGRAPSREHRFEMLVLPQPLGFGGFEFAHRLGSLRDHRLQPLRRHRLVRLRIGERPLQRFQRRCSSTRCAFPGA